MAATPPRESLENNEPKTPPHTTTQIQPPTPTVPSNAASQPYTSTHVFRPEAIKAMYQEITGKVLGPMPLKDFLNEFVPAAQGPAPVPNPEALEKLRVANTEYAMYEPFVEAFKPCCSQMYIRDTHHIPFETHFQRDIKPDITFFQGKFQCTKPGGRETIDKVAIMTEAKYMPGDDPFDDKIESFERSTGQAQDTLGQICSYATAQMAAQFRTHLFSLLLFREYARILRWDRAGVIVTQKINLADLSKFLWRYDKMTRVQQGFDEDIVPISLKEVEQFDPKALKKLTTSKNPLLFSITFPDGNRFVIQTPVYMGTASPTGRSTRTFHALHLQTGNIVFLKDTWRVISPGLIPEHEVYDKLKAANVPNVASVLTYKDIDGHVTRTLNFEQAPWLKSRGTRRFRKFQHYRLVLHQVARPLESFLNTKVLVRVILDALEAHRLAHDNANILHRDISAGNIMIAEDGRGLLIDWDLSKNLIIDPEAVSPAERTGTWQFMAARLIMARGPGTPVPVPNRDDDLESFWHVLLWTAIRQCEHTMPDANITNSLRTLFDHAYVGPTGQAGGEIKLNSLISNLFIGSMNLGSLPLHNILLGAARVLGSRYPTDKKMEDDVRKVQEIWDTVRMKNPDLHTTDPREEIVKDKRFSELELYSALPIWSNRRQLTSSQWMEAIFKKVLDDPQADWITGSANVKRQFPRPAKDVKRKRETDINDIGDMPQQPPPKKISNLESLPE